MRKPPSRGMCLWLSQMYWEMQPQTAANKQRSWEYLICWGMYDMYVEGWWQE